MFIMAHQIQGKMEWLWVIDVTGIITRYYKAEIICNSKARNIEESYFGIYYRESIFL